MGAFFHVEPAGRAAGSPSKVKVRAPGSSRHRSSSLVHHRQHHESLQPAMSSKGEPEAKRPRTAVAAEEVIEFQMIKSTLEGLAIEQDGRFPPAMTHQ